MAQSLFKRYGDKIQFLTAFNPSIQKYAVSNPAKCYFGTAPVLSAVAKAYGEETASSWIEAELHDLANYAGSKDKLTREQSMQTATNILAAYSYLNMAELLLFFARFKAGKYGRFYGSVDPLVITTALSEFSKQRIAEITAIEMAMKQQERMKEREGCVSHEEYLKIRERAEAGDRAAQELLKKPKKQCAH